MIWWRRAGTSTHTEVAVGVEIRGAEQLRALSRQLKLAGERGLADELRQGLRDAAKPAEPAVRRAALEDLPRHGHLNQRVADRAAMVVKNVPGGVRLVMDKGSRSIDQGRARHPLPHNRAKWYTTQVRPGFFTGTLSEMALDFERGMQRAIDRIERRLQP